MRRLLFLSAAILLGGCANLPNSDIRHEYVDMAQRIGITPVYPPREEVQVGDIYLVSHGLQSGKLDLKDSARVWIGEYRPLVAEAVTHLGSRIAFTATKPEAQANGLGQDDISSNTFKRRSGAALKTLPISALPRVTADASRSGDVAAFGALRALGISIGRRTQVTLDFNDVRTYGAEEIKVNHGDLYQQVRRDITQGGGRHLAALKREEAFERLRGRRLDEDRCILLVAIRRVYLTRSINYTYTDAAIRSIAARAAQTGSPPAAPSPVTITIGADGTATPPAPAAPAHANVQAGPNSGALTFVNWNALGVTFNRKFAQPVAIAWEGINLPMNVGDRPECELPNS